MGLDAPPGVNEVQVGKLCLFQFANFIIFYQIDQIIKSKWVWPSLKGYISGALNCKTSAWPGPQNDAVPKAQNIK